MVSGQLFWCNARYTHSIKQLGCNKSLQTIYILASGQTFCTCIQNSGPCFNIYSCCSFLGLQQFHYRLCGQYTCRLTDLWIKNIYETSEWMPKWFHIHPARWTDEEKHWKQSKINYNNRKNTLNTPLKKYLLTQWLIFLAYFTLTMAKQFMRVHHPSYTNPKH